MNGKNTTTPKEQIKIAHVDVNAIVSALEYNGQPPEYKNRRTAVIRINPPFEPEIQADRYMSQEGNYYPPEMDPMPIHISPRAFVEQTQETAHPDLNDVRAYAKEMLEDPTEDEIDKFVNESYNFWRDLVQRNLKDEVDIAESDMHGGEPNLVSVIYEGEK